MKARGIEFIEDIKENRTGMMQDRDFCLLVVKVSTGHT
jgi:hypothetical protein